MMNEKVGEIFSIAKTNTPIPGCTVSKEVYRGSNSITYFSMAKNTDISGEIYNFHKLFFIVDGSMEIYGDGFEKKLEVNEAIITPMGVALGIRTKESVIFIEISINKEDVMNNQIKIGDVFRLKDLVPYSEGKIVNMDIMHNDKMKFALMAFDEGTELSEHAAPGEALVIALDGEGIIGYEGREYEIKEGENFIFEKEGKHFVKAKKKFKMALVLSLE